MTAEISPHDHVVRAQSLQVIYQRGAVPAVDGVDLQLAPGDGLLLTGDHGAGKSTVLRAICGLVRFGGEVTVMSSYPGTRRATAHVGFGPQGKGFAIGQSPRALVGMVAALRGAPTSTLRDIVAAALTAAGIPDEHANRPTADVELVRRVALACAVAGEPPLVVLDDPWEFAQTQTVIDATRSRGGAVLAASGDPGGLPQMLGRTLALADGVPV